MFLDCWLSCNLCAYAKNNRVRRSPFVWTKSGHPGRSFGTQLQIPHLVGRDGRRSLRVTTATIGCTALDQLLPKVFYLLFSRSDDASKSPGTTVESRPRGRRIGRWTGRFRLLAAVRRVLCACWRQVILDKPICGSPFLRSNVFGGSVQQDARPSAVLDTSASWRSGNWYSR